MFSISVVAARLPLTRLSQTLRPRGPRVLEGPPAVPGRRLSNPPGPPDVLIRTMNVTGDENLQFKKTSSRIRSFIGLKFKVSAEVDGGQRS